MTLDWSLYLQTHMIYATVMLQMPPQLRGVSGPTTFLQTIHRKEGSPLGEGGYPTGHGQNTAGRFTKWHY